MAIERLRVLGSTPQQHVLFMSFFAQGIDGRRGLPYVLVGEPGTAKTSIVSQLARQSGLHAESLLGSIRSPVDYLGVPFLRKERYDNPDTLETEEVSYTHYAAPAWAVKAARLGRCVINFDELNTASMSVQAAMLRVLFEGVVGEFPLPKGVRQLACMNPVSQAAGGRQLALPLINRIGQLDWPAPTVEGFVGRMLSSGAEPEEPINALAEEEHVDALWPQAYARAVGEVSGFLKRVPSALHKLPTVPGAPWPSTRTWELALRALTGSYVYALSPEEEMLACKAFVSDGVWREFAQWRRTADLPDPEALLDGEAHFEHQAARIDRTAAVLSSCTALVSPAAAPKRKERVESFWKILKDIPDGALDVALPSVTTLCQAKLAQGSSTAYKMLARLEPVMSAAGIIKS